MHSLTLGKGKRVFLRNEIQTLFSSRVAFISYPFRVVVAEEERTLEPLKMMVSVPKKRLKHAVDRNRVKRLTREAFRLNCSHLRESIPEETCLLIGFIYIGNEVKSYTTTSHGIMDALDKLALKYQTNDNAI